MLCYSVSIRNFAGTEPFAQRMGSTGTVVPSVTRIRYFKLYQYGLGHEISLRLEPWRKLSSKDMSVKIIFNIVRYPDVITWELRKERQFGFL
jgi:hypothetical protein